MAAIKATYGKNGAAGIAVKDLNGVDLATALRDLIADVTAQRAAIVALTAKLDADIAAGGATETNYAATVNPPALLSTAP